jgi:hypothetical protein
MAGSVRAFPTYYSPIGSQKLTVDTAVGLTLPNAPQTRAVQISVEGYSIRFQVDGTTPDSTTGHLLYVTDVLELTNVNAINNLKMIKVTSAATVQITYYGGGV